MKILQIIITLLMLSMSAYARDDQDFASRKNAVESKTDSGNKVTKTVDLKRFIRQADIPLKGNTESTGNQNDDGVFKSLINKENGSKDIVLGIGWLKPGEVHLLHHHTTASEFYYVLKGSASITSGEEVQQVYSGTAVYIPAGDSHKIVNNGEETLEILFGYNTIDLDTIFDE